MEHLKRLVTGLLIIGAIGSAYALFVAITWVALTNPRFALLPLAIILTLIVYACGAAFRVYK